MIPLSPGMAHSCFELLEVISRRHIRMREIPVSLGRVGVVSIESALQASQGLRWVHADDTGRAILTPSGLRIAGQRSEVARLRQTILDYVDAENPVWLQNAVFGRKKLMTFVEIPVAQVFLEAGLVDGVAKDVVDFWDALAQRARGQRDQQLLAIGRRGERLSLAYEKDRTGKQPKWVAIDTNEDGYDILSVVSQDDPARLTIEVKATSVGMAGSFHVTRNEWERSQGTVPHVFHLWDLSRNPRLAVVLGKDVSSHVPSDTGLGRWRLAEIPFRVFEQRFAPVFAWTEPT